MNVTAKASRNNNRVLIDALLFDAECTSDPDALDAIAASLQKYGSAEAGRVYGKANTVRKNRREAEEAKRKV